LLASSPAAAQAHPQRPIDTIQPRTAALGFAQHVDLVSERMDLQL
jgi:hypothetical protein